MPEVSAQEKQRLKQESAAMAITDANISQYMAGAAAVLALVSPPHAAALGLGAAMMGVCGNYRQAIANDPPRDDFDQIVVTQASLDETVLPDDEPRRTLYQFAAHQLMLMDALYLLLVSLERYDGAMNVGALEAAGNQADAVRQNAEAAAALQDNLSLLAPEVNQAWDSLRVEFAPDWNSLTIQQVQQFYRETWGEPPQAPSVALQELAQSVTGALEDILEPFDPMAAHPILSATELPNEREKLVNDRFVEGLVELSDALRNLVVAI